MKTLYLIKTTILFLLMSVCCMVEARSPYTRYDIEYVSDAYGMKSGFGRDGKHSIKLTNTGSAYVYSPQKPDKRWDIEYQGKYTLSKWGDKTFHRFYLTNHRVYLYVSDEKIYNKDGILYYVIDFNGQTQLAL